MVIKMLWLSVCWLQSVRDVLYDDKVKVINVEYVSVFLSSFRKHSEDVSLFLSSFGSVEWSDSCQHLGCYHWYDTMTSVQPRFLYGFLPVCSLVLPSPVVLCCFLADQMTSDDSSVHPMYLQGHLERETVTLQEGLLPPRSPWERSSNLTGGPSFSSEVPTLEESNQYRS